MRFSASIVLLLSLASVSFAQGAAASISAAASSSAAAATSSAVSPAIPTPQAPSGCNASFAFYIVLAPGNYSNTVDPYLSSKGQSTSGQKNAAQFVLVSCKDGNGYLAVLNPSTGKLTYYGDSTSVASLKMVFKYTFKQLDKQNINGTWSINTDQTLSITNPFFATCDESATFCISFAGKKPQIGSNVNVIGKSPAKQECRTIYLIVECVDPDDCAVADDYDAFDCPAVSSTASASASASASAAASAAQSSSAAATPANKARAYKEARNHEDRWDDYWV